MDGVPGAGGPRLSLIGSFAVCSRGGAPDLPASAQRLLALLALEGPSSRSTVAGRLWPDVLEEHALGSLRTTVWRLRRRCDGLIASTGERIALAPGVEVDVHAFLALTRRVLDAGDPAGDRVRDLAAVRAGAGELLPGWDEDWVAFPREQVRQLRLHALEALSAQLLRLGRCASALDAALAAVQLDPLRESAHCAVVAAHLAEANHTEAVRAYRSFARLSVAELGVGPSPRLRGLLGAPPRRHELVPA